MAKSLPIRVARCEPSETLPLRTRYRLEMNCQIVHDSIHRRPGWTQSFHLFANEAFAGFATVATGGPWKTKPAFMEFYVLPEFRSRAFALFEQFMSVARPRYFEIQSNDTLAAVMAFTFGDRMVIEKIVFQDLATTSLRAKGALLRAITPESEVRRAIHERQGGGEWNLELKGKVVGKGGILFHYNVPYGDVYMDISEQYRRRGLGSYLVQEIKRAAYELGAIPSARCNPDNIASRRTLQRAGFVPFANIVNGRL